MVRFYSWAFVLIGPFASAFGVFALVQGFWWQGSLLVLLGLWWTSVGWTRLFRFAQSRLRREH